MHADEQASLGGGETVFSVQALGGDVEHVAHQREMIKLGETVSVGEAFERE